MANNTNNTSDESYLLSIEYDTYLIMIRESGVPLWVLDYYSPVSLLSVREEKEQPPRS